MKVGIKSWDVRYKVGGENRKRRVDKIENWTKKNEKYNARMVGAEGKKTKQKRMR